MLRVHRISPAIYEFGSMLRRGVWQPLRRMMDIFHVLPLVAAALIFILLAANGQLRELYLTYLEILKTEDFWTAVVWFLTAFLGFGLLSATLYEAHYWLSARRISIIYSADSNPDAATHLRGLQRMAAIVLALVPWFGIVAGLFNASVHLETTAKQICSQSSAPSNQVPLTYLTDVPDLAALQGLLKAGTFSTVLSAILLGISIAIFLDYHRKSMIAHTVVILATPLATVVFLYLLKGWPFPNFDTWNTALLYGGFVALISAGYFAVQYRLLTMRTAVIFTHSFRRNTGFNRRRRQRVGLFVWAFAPWLATALYVGLSVAFSGTASATSLCRNLSTDPHWVAETGLPRWVAETGLWTTIPLAMSWAITTGILLTIALDQIRRSRNLAVIVVGTILALMAVALFKSHFDDEPVVGIYRSLGPLGTLALALLFVLSIFTLLSVLSHKSGFPVLALAVAAIVISALVPTHPEWVGYFLILVFSVLGVMALVSRMFDVAGVAFFVLFVAILITLRDNGTVKAKQAPDKENNFEQSEVVKHFTNWLDQKLGAEKNLDAYRNEKGAYPVFIVAVEGGGIYATAAASIFLARLQERSPQFSKHIFAISAVSGGAIGATVFHALNRPLSAGSIQVDGDLDNVRDLTTAQSKAGLKAGLKAAGPVDCTKPLGILAMTTCVLAEDYFSPVVGSIFPEFFGWPRNGRAEALAAGFTTSVRQFHDQAASQLDNRYIDHWDIGRSKIADNPPALILNTTWAETGSRVAFAPFPLHRIDETLYSFLDMDMPNLHKKKRDITTKKPDEISLIDAAVSSARFPLILPPLAVAMPGIDSKTKKPTALTWNFVDGGYSDSSGAATALALYKAIAPVADKYRGNSKFRVNVVVKVILVTSSNPAPDLRKEKVEITGTVFRDMLVPINAVMSVREGLANQSVTRACYDIYKYRDEQDRNRDKSDAERKDNKNNQKSDTTNLFRKDCLCESRKSDAPIKIVEIEDKTYGLPLGWKLSKTTLGVVSWMLGNKDFCTRRIAENAPCDGRMVDDRKGADKEQAAELQDSGKGSGQIEGEANIATMLRNSCVLEDIGNMLVDRR